MSTTPQQLAAHQAAIVLAEGARQGGPGGGEGQLFRLGLRLGNVRCGDKSGGRGLLQSSYRQQRVERLGNWAFAHVARVNGPGLMNMAEADDWVDVPPAPQVEHFSEGGVMPQYQKTPLRFGLLAAVLWLSAAPAFGQERKSADFIVPLGYCQLTSTPSLNSSAAYTANQREGASPPLARS
ncbi:hypothetical protein [Bradyrhizobium sp.]|uniref:hypothetical protein n=1 Tax=Bradyrhizobium sp. TaxID=376 RepID=UPI003BAFD51B